MSLPGGEMHDKLPKRHGKGNHKKPLRCTDVRCPSRSKCKRPDFEGDGLDFSFNRDGGDICGYFVRMDDSAI